MTTGSETHGTTELRHDGVVEQTNVRSVMPYSEILPQMADQNDVTDFLAKPIIVDQFAFTSTSVANDFIYANNIADFLNARQIWYRKLAGYRMIRGDAVVKIVVNANPFQQGRLMLNFLPCWSQINPVGPYDRIHWYDLCTKTQAPNVELDLQETSATMVIPYVAPTLFYDRDNNEFDWGRVAVTVLSPLQTGSSGPLNVEVSVFLSFENVKLAGPQYGPEGAKDQVMRTRVRRERKLTSRTGVVSSILDTIGESASVLEKVPIIGQYASIGADYLGKFADALNIFGFSKPLTSQTASIMTTNPARLMQNSEGEAPSDVMAMGHATSLPVLADAFGTDIDEMSFAFLKKRPAYIGAFAFTTTDVHDTSLYSVKVGPKYLFGSDVAYSNPPWSGTVRTSPPFAYLGRFFRYYRGGIKLHFKFVKTGYHSGRLAFQFSTKQEQVSIGNPGTYLLREIVDLRSTDELTLVIPYMRSTNYLYTDMQNQSADDYSTLGTLDVRVVNELRAPETCAPQFQILVYASAADDFEYVIPEDNGSMAFAPEGVYGDDKYPEKGIGNSSEDSSDLMHNFMSVADPFTSVKQLLNSTRQVFCGNSGPTSLPFQIYPFNLGLFRGGGQGPVGLCGDYVAELSLGYAFSRGGVRIMSPAGEVNSNITAAITTVTDAFGDRTYNEVPPPLLNSLNSLSIVTPLADSTTAAFRRLMVQRNAQWGYDVNIPHYLPTPIRSNYSGSTVPDQIDVQPQYLAFYTTTMSSVTQANYFQQLYRAGGDDYCLGYFIGFPPYILNWVYTP